MISILLLQTQIYNMIQWLTTSGLVRLLRSNVPFCTYVWEGDANFVSRDQIYNEAMKERKAFMTTMQIFQKEDREKSRSDLKIIVEADWRDILDAVNDAQHDAEVNAIKGASGSIRNLTRKLGDAGPAFTDWLEILPSDLYGSVLRGGFLIVINAAIRHKELCQEVFNAIGEIPEVIRGAEFSFTEYKSDELHRRVAKLYNTIIETLHGILDFYKERASGRHRRAALNAFKAITRGSNYGQQIELNINNVKDAANLVKQEANRCMHRRVGEIKTAQDYQTLQAAQIKNTSSEGLNVVRKIYEDLQYRFKCQDLQWKEAKANNLALRAELMDLRRAIIPEPVQRQGPSSRMMYQLMGTSPDIVYQDMQEVLRSAQRFSAGLQTQAGEFMGSQRLQNWLTSPYSCNLLANGASGDHKISSFSFVATLLTQSLEVSKEALSLSFYCGLHTDAYRDGLSDAEGMIRSLIIQLLATTSYDFDLEFVDRRFIQALEANNLDALCALFEGIINQIPASVVLFLVIDGISFYETKDRVQSACIVMSRIIDVADKAKFVFKLLVTSPGASPYVSGGFSKEELFWLPDDDSENNSEFNYDVEAFQNQARAQAAYQLRP